MPVLDSLLTQLPAQLHELAVSVGGEVDQSLQRTFQLNAHAIEVRHRFQKLHLRAANRVASLLLTLLSFGRSGRSFRLVLSDAGLVLQLRQKGGEFGDLGDNPAHAGQLVVRLLHRICAEPLHWLTIAPITGSHPAGRWCRQTSFMDATEMRRRVAAARVARLATADPDGRPHIVPITFVLDDNTLYFAIDAKPKRTTNLKRLRNVAANPAVSILIDHYEDDWGELWWVRVDGSARVLTDGPAISRALDLLAQRYAQYRTTRPTGPVVAVSVEGISGWSAA